MANRGGKCGSMTDFLFLCFKITVNGDHSHEIRRQLLLGRKAMTNLDSVLKSRHYSADKRLYNQGYGIPSDFPGGSDGKESAFNMRDLWELDCKKSRALKIWCLLTVILEKTPESPLDSKEIKTVNLKRDQPWIFPGRTDAEAIAPVFWPTDANRRLIGKVTDAGQDRGQKEKRMSDDEMAGQHHQCNEHELGQTLGEGKGQKAWCAAVSGVAKSWTRLGNWTTMMLS